MSNSTTLVYSPYIDAPTLTCCESVELVVGNGTAPYTISVITSGDSSGSVLETLPTTSTKSAGTIKWKVDFDAAANITFVVTDSAGNVGYSASETVVAGSYSTCSKTDYTKSTSHSHVGAIVGGVLGAVAAVALLFAALWWMRRQRRKREASSTTTPAVMGAGTKRSLSKRQSTKRASATGGAKGRGREDWYEEDESEVGEVSSPTTRESCEKATAATAATLASRV